MRKYSLSYAVCALMAILLMFSLGYTYAYFSATKAVTGNVSLHNVGVQWENGDFELDAPIATLFDDPTQIVVKSTLSRGTHCPITAETKTEGDIDVILAMRNTGSTPINCRIKINATYVTKNGETKTCGDQWIKLALSDEYDPSSITFITDNGWVYHNGYYYYGSSTSSLTDVNAGRSVPVADRLYLDPTSNADMYGASVSISIVIEAVQAEHDAYKSEWGLA